MAAEKAASSRGGPPSWPSGAALAARGGPGRKGVCPPSPRLSSFGKIKRNEGKRGRAAF